MHFIFSAYVSLAPGASVKCEYRTEIDTRGACTIAISTIYASYSNVIVDVKNRNNANMPPGCIVHRRCEPETGKNCFMFFNSNMNGINSGSYSPICFNSQTETGNFFEILWFGQLISYYDMRTKKIINKLKKVTQSHKSNSKMFKTCKTICSLGCKTYFPGYSRGIFLICGSKFLRKSGVIWDVTHKISSLILFLEAHV